MKLKDYNKRFMLHLTSQLHSTYKVLAIRKKVTMNELIIKVLEQYVENGLDQSVMNLED